MPRSRANACWMPEPNTSSTGTGDVAVIVVSHWSGALLEECLARVCGAEAVAELVLVDNDTRDGSIEALHARLGGDPRLRVVRNDAPVTAVLNLVFRPQTPEQKRGTDLGAVGDQIDLIIEEAKRSQTK